MKKKGGRPRKYPSEGVLSRLSISIPDADKAQLAAVSDAFGLSISELVIRLLRQGLTPEVLAEAERLAEDRSAVSHLIGSR